MTSHIRCALLVIICTLPLRGQSYSFGESVSSDASKTKLVLLRDEAAGIEAAIVPAKGGELSGLAVRFKDQWIETLYLARDYSPRQSWTGKAPFLWPATGREASARALGGFAELAGARQGADVFGAWRGLSLEGPDYSRGRVGQSHQPACPPIFGAAHTRARKPPPRFRS